MIGPKKLATIRDDLRRALTATGEDPLRWLEARMSAPAGQAADTGESEGVRSLRRFLDAPPRPGRKRPRAKSRK